MRTKNIHQIQIFSLLAIIFMLSQSCVSSKQKAETVTVVISNQDGLGYSFEMNVTRGKAHHYPLMAAWIEDLNGTYIQTLYVARSVAKGEYDHADASLGEWKSGPLRRAATLPYWAHKYNSVANNDNVFPSPAAPVPDAYTGATPAGSFKLQSKSDALFGKPFRIWFEINQFFDFNNFWTNSKYPDDADYKTSGQPALIFVSDVIDPDKLPQTNTLRPIGHSHYSGKDGGLYISLETLTTARQIVKEISVTVKK